MSCYCVILCAFNQKKESKCPPCFSGTEEMFLKELFTSHNEELRHPSTQYLVGLHKGSINTRLHVMDKHNTIFSEILLQK